MLEVTLERRDATGSPRTASRCWCSTAGRGCRWLATGTLWADSSKSFCASSRGVAASTPSAASPLAVVGRCPSGSPPGPRGIESAELNGKVNQLELKIDHAPPATPARATAAAATPISTAASRAAAGNPCAVNAADPGSRTTSGRHAEDRRRHARNRRPTCAASASTAPWCSRNRPPRRPASPPLRIVAEHLQVTGADTPNAQIEIRGGGGQNGLPQQIAEITARGAELRARGFALNRGTSQAWINSPGEVKMLVDRDMAGKPLAAARSR